MSGGQAGGLVAALGALWAHAVNTRLVLESVGAARYVRVRPRSCRMPTVPWCLFGMQVAKPAAAPSAAVAYRVTHHSVN